MRKTIVSMLAVGVALSLGAHDASAKPRKHPVQPISADEAVHELPLTVNKRSFLDPGPVVPTGSGQNYIAANTIFNKTQDRIFEPAKFGDSELQGQPYVPGRTVSVVEFSTGPRIGDVELGQVLGIR